jgi:hypothetical protein
MYQKDSQNQTWCKTIVETQVQVIKKQFGATQLIRRLDGIIVHQYRKIIQRKNAQDRGALDTEANKIELHLGEHARDGTPKLLISMVTHLKEAHNQA